MPKLTQYGKVFRDWESLLGATDKRAAMLPGVDDLKASLTTLLAKARDLKLQQEGFSGDKKGSTEQLKQAVKDARDAASMLRSFVKSRLGIRTEVLKEFGITPAGSRKRAKTTETPPPTTTPGTQPPPTTTPETPQAEKPAAK